MMPVVLIILLLLAVTVLIAILSTIALYWMKGTKANLKYKWLNFTGPPAIMGGVLIIILYFFPGFIQNVLKTAVDTELALQPLKTIKNGIPTETEEVGFSPKTQLFTIEKLNELDRNRMYVNDKLGIAVKRPSTNDGWEIVENLDSIPSAGFSDIPVVEGFFNSVQVLYGTPKFPIFCVRHKDGYEITFEENSIIDSIPIKINPYKEHADIMASRIEYYQSRWDDKFKFGQWTNLLTLDYFSKVSEDIMNRDIPMKKVVHSGVYVMEIPKYFFEESLFGKIAPSLTLLDNIFWYLTMSGKFGHLSIKNLSIDQKNKIGSFDGSSYLENIKVKEKNTNAVVNSISFIIGGEHYGKYVNLISISPPDDGAIFNDLIKYLKSLRFVQK